jgi:5-formyltetrahydrofolate cyclo-ligase
MGDLAGKAAWRTRARMARAALSPSALVAAADAVSRHLLARLRGSPRVAAYVPVGAEPGSLRMLDLMSGGGTVVLLPVLAGDDLDWSIYDGADRLVTGRYRLLEPVGQPLGAHAIAEVDAVLVPALAVDHRGNRLGRGAGYYDRALARVAPSTPVVALLHDGELVPELPSDPWDRPVTAVVTPRDGWTPLPLVAHHGT